MHKNIFVSVSQALGKNMASQSEGHRVWYLNFVIPLIISLSLHVIIDASSPQRTILQCYCFFPTFSLCSWVQLEVADVNLGADVTLIFCCLQRNTSGIGHWAKEIQHIQGHWQEPLCDLLSSAFPARESDTLAWDLMLTQHPLATHVLTLGHGQHVKRFSRFHCFGQAVYRNGLGSCKKYDIS